MPNPNTVENEFLVDMEKYSVQGRATRAPFESGVPGVAGPGVGDNAFGPGGFILQLAATADEFIPWSYYPMRRDRQLRRLWKSEVIMAGAVYAMSSRIGALPYKVSGPPRLRGDG